MSFCCVECGKEFIGNLQEMLLKVSLKDFTDFCFNCNTIVLFRRCDKEMGDQGVDVDIHKEFDEITKLIDDKSDTIEKLKDEIESLHDKQDDLMNKMIDDKNKQILLNVSRCPKCNTILIKKYTQLVKDYCPKCKDGLVYVIDTETGKGKQCFLKDLTGGKKNE